MHPLLRLALATSIACLTACSSSEAAPETSLPAASGAGAPATAPAVPLPDSPDGRPRVAIADGTLEGLRIDGGVRAFLGIPFARPPVGALRWQRPQANEPWQDARDASHFGPRCPQPPSSDPLDVASEDCLYLNVWTPAVDRPLPVMVWIHGGGNVNGSSFEPAYDGQFLARDYGIVLVSINYRLGVFGFFGAAGLAAESGSAGNQGLWDQQLALHWVQKNIARFGGDASNVTIFGESAGSADVCYHVAAPGSRGLFQRAISESGGCTSRVADADSAQRTAAAFAERMGCTGADALACLRSKSVRELVDGAAAAGRFPISVDGVFLPEQPRALFDRGDIARVPYILGSNTDEGSYWALDAVGISDDAK